MHLAIMTLMPSSEQSGITIPMSLVPQSIRQPHIGLGHVGQGY